MPDKSLCVGRGSREGRAERKDSEGRGGHPHSGLKRWAQLRVDELLNASAADQFRKAIVLPQLAPGGLT